MRNEDFEPVKIDKDIILETQEIEGNEDDDIASEYIKSENALLGIDNRVEWAEENWRSLNTLSVLSKLRGEILLKIFHGKNKVIFLITDHFFFTCFNRELYFLNHVPLFHASNNLTLARFFAVRVSSLYCIYFYYCFEFNE